MKRWWLMIALLLSVGVNVGILATLAFQPRPAAGGAAGAGTGSEGAAELGPEAEPLAADQPLPPVIRRMADELGLEGGQREAFIEIQRAFFEQTISARSRMARLQREIRSGVTSEEPDREALDRLLIELSAAHTDLERAFVTNLLDSRQLLDGEQERRFMHFLRRLRHVRGEVEQRFRERWRGMEGRDGRGLGPRGRRGPGRQRFERPALEPPAGGEAVPAPPGPG